MNKIISNINEANLYLENRISPAYSKSSFDAFLKEVQFSYNIPSIHITGTNGKGSTANFIKNIYQSSGLKTGLFVSPSLNSFQEMISISGELIKESYVVSFFKKYLSLFEKFNLTAFEIETFLAFSYLQDQKVDIGIIEVGMGGRIDATNIFIPVLSIITNVGLEHTSYLGKTIAEIAFHKAGIIKLNQPVLVGDLKADALEVVKNVAKENNSKLFTIKKASNIKRDQKQIFDYGKYKELVLLLKAPYQIINASLAVEAVRIISNRFPITERNIKEGLLATNMPARFEVVGHNPEIIIDGGHNPEAIKELVRAMKDYEKFDIHILFAAFKDKDISSMLKDLESISKSITLTSFDHIRARKKDDFKEWNLPFVEDFKKAYQQLRINVSSRSVILITGSLAFAGLMRHLLTNGELKT